jgi:hypothetical protein
MFRCPLPHRFKSHTSPDVASEKIRGEAATFAWLSAHCPNVPVPQLLGFGLPGGRTFVPLVLTSWVRRAYEWVRRQVERTFFNVDCWRPFVPCSSPVLLDTGYLITDFIEPRQGRMLSTIWPSYEPDRHRTLFRGLADVLLDLMQMPLPRIGSFTVSDKGVVTLGGRPLTAALASMEAEGVCSEMSPTTTYSSTSTYIDNLLHCHDMRLRDQPNAVEDEYDAAGQIATVVVLKAIRSHFIDRSLRQEPFILQFTDLHDQNILVDDQCNIIAIVDLEFSCSLPVEMQQLPHWFSGNEGDDFLGDEAAESEEAYVTACKEFLDLLGHEQSRRSPPRLLVDAKNIFSAALEKKSHWYFTALCWPRTAYSFLIHHLQPLFAPSHAGPEAGRFQDTFAPYHVPNVSGFVDKKIRDKDGYDQTLRESFEE